jgi:hypothetical protein
MQDLTARRQPPPQTRLPSTPVIRRRHHLSVPPPLLCFIWPCTRPSRITNGDNQPFGPYSMLPTLHALCWSRWILASVPGRPFAASYMESRAGIDRHLAFGARKGSTGNIRRLMLFMQYPAVLDDMALHRRAEPVGTGKCSATRRL